MIFLTLIILLLLGLLLTLLRPCIQILDAAFLISRNILLLVFSRFFFPRIVVLLSHLNLFFYYRYYYFILFVSLVNRYFFWIAMQLSRNNKYSLKSRRQKNPVISKRF